MTEPVLDVHELSKKFGALVACDDVCLDVRVGEIHALIGPNGAGKTTLLKQISGALSPDHGSVRLMGEDVTAQSAEWRAQHGLARTFQISALAMEMTVRENVLLGAVGKLHRQYSLFAPVHKNADLNERADDALSRVGLLDAARAPVASLSHGERRQLEVAIALTQSPRVFVMDEPMAGMGGEGSRRLTGFLDGLREQAPILLVEHDMDAVFALADRVSVLVAGRVIASGTVDEVRMNVAVRTAYLGDER